ncbi:cupredoxin family copper-binding protein [Methanobacterium sp.]|uniref:cupredoxin domain-containing protein n=1 Tax=Methanobacterium sp. TaxID=2164 RepID=UPI002ABB98B9|nr:cupredoxin family copper-binding protein [Methanobacterium sp.]MDY9923198.1 cupredoxin family copper-binding protein [Methanobacterium sp.]
MKNEYLIFMIFGIVAIVALSGCTNENSTGNNSSSNSTGNSVSIQNFAFNPSTLTVKAGTTVTWTNKDSTNHPVASDTGVFASGDLNNGDSYSYTFNQTGNYPYHCTTHTSMKGTIIVQ